MRGYPMGELKDLGKKVLLGFAEHFNGVPGFSSADYRYNA